MTIELLIPGAHCGWCRAAILRCLSTAPGVRSAELDLREHRASVVIDTAVTDVAAIRTRLAAAGYPPAPLSRA